MITGLQQRPSKVERRFGHLPLRLLLEIELAANAIMRCGPQPSCYDNDCLAGQTVWFVCPLLGLFSDEQMLVSLPPALALVLFEHHNFFSKLARASVPYGAAVVAALVAGWLRSRPVR